MQHCWHSSLLLSSQIKLAKSLRLEKDFTRLPFPIFFVDFHQRHQVTLLDVQTRPLASCAPTFA